MAASDARLSGDSRALGDGAREDLDDGGVEALHA